MASARKRVARLICDVYKPNGEPFEGDPRYILKKVIKEADAMGYAFNVGPELEFFLFHTDDYGMPTTETHEKGGYFDLDPIDLGENARRDMVLTLEDMGFEIEASHHEVAPAQHEIDLHMMLTQRTILKPSSWLSNPLRNAMVFMRPLCRSLFTVCLVPACISTCHWMTRMATIFLVIRMMRMVSAKQFGISRPVC